MPPRRSRRTAGQDPDQLEVAEVVEKLEVVEVAEKGQRKPGGVKYVGKVAAEGEEAEADAVETDVGSSLLGAEKTKLDVEDTDKTSTINQEDFEKKNSAEKPDCGEVLQADDGIGERQQKAHAMFDNDDCQTVIGQSPQGDGKAVLFGGS